MFQETVHEKMRQPIDTVLASDRLQVRSTSPFFRLCTSDSPLFPAPSKHADLKRSTRLSIGTSPSSRGLMKHPG
jgi:hypothetical protein